MLLILLFTILIQLVYSDQRFYADTNAESVPDIYTMNDYKQIMQLKVITSNKYLANTVDNIYITFIGDFSTSGPHSIGSQATVGGIVDITIYLHRIIGRLQSVLFQKQGNDAWLLSSLTCTSSGVTYEIQPQNQQWLSVFNQVTGELYNGNGYEPNAAEELSDLPAGAVITLPVTNVVKQYTLTNAVADTY